jgi:predicted MPP superfamily phosphohydrolase
MTTLTKELIFHAVLLPVDVILLFVLWHAAPKRLWYSVFYFAVWFITACLLAFALQALLGTHPKMMLAARFFTRIVFWHVPLWLLLVAAICKSRRIAMLCSMLAAALVAVYVYSHHVEPRWVEISRHTVTSLALRGLERPILIAQIADPQFDRVTEYERKTLKSVAALKPDLVLFLGDYAQTAGDEHRHELMRAYADAVREAGIDPPFGSYAIRGNVDWRGIWQENFAGTGVVTLEDEVVVLELPGLQVPLLAFDYTTTIGNDPERAGALLDEAGDVPFILIAGHNPAFSKYLGSEETPFLALAGHTHGGQIRLPFIGALYPMHKLYDVDRGDFQPLGPGHLSVSRGLGLERADAPRMRFFCRPEIRLIELRPPE